MVTETLVCSFDGHEFQRERVRGRKPKTCPEHKSQPKQPERLFKALGATEESSGIERERITFDSGDRDPQTLDYPECEIPDDAMETLVNGPNGVTKRYDKVIVDGVPFKAGDDVKIVNDGVRGRYEVHHFDMHPKGYMYWTVVGTSGPYLGKYRSVDPGRIAR